jgi:hypothetical protein
MRKVLHALERIIKGNGCVTGLAVFQKSRDVRESDDLELLFEDP